jgi:hypothetical protein
MSAMTEFQLDADAGARAWLDAHPTARGRLIAFDVHRCCGGGKICSVNVRELSKRDDPDDYASGTLEDGTRFLVDRRAAVRLPSRFGLTVRGLGRFKHLDLVLEPAEWGELLYR